VKTITLTEFNQNPSRATRLADTDDVLVLRRGVVAYRLQRVHEEPGDDPVEALVQAGLLSPPRRSNKPRPQHLPVAHTDIDLGAELEADRGRLDG
jgi:hypothetical protein